MYIIDYTYTSCIAHVYFKIYMHVQYIVQCTMYISVFYGHYVACILYCMYTCICMYIM